jgi:hypothetical protein
VNWLKAEKSVFLGFVFLCVVFLCFVVFALSTPSMFQKVFYVSSR